MFIASRNPDLWLRSEERELMIVETHPTLPRAGTDLSEPLLLVGLRLCCDSASLSVKPSRVWLSLRRPWTQRFRIPLLN